MYDNAKEKTEELTRFSLRAWNVSLDVEAVLCNREVPRRCSSRNINALQGQRGNFYMAIVKCLFSKR